METVWLECDGEEINLGTVEEVLDPAYAQDVRAGVEPDSEPRTTTHAINLFLADVLSNMIDEDLDEAEVSITIKR
jgi:hypothetical protein